MKNKAKGLFHGASKQGGPLLQINFLLTVPDRIYNMKVPDLTGIRGDFGLELRRVSTSQNNKLNSKLFKGLIKLQTVQQVVDFLISHQLKVTTAESCTAGLMAARIADISGCGPAFERGYVVYAPEAKNDLLGVSFDTIEQYGLCSEPVAREMALGALRRSGSNMAIADTGAAESDDELDGVVCFACALLIDGREKVISETVKFDGSRNEVRRAAADYALLQLPQYFDTLVRT